MRLSEAIKHQGKPFEIPDCSRHDLPEFFKEMGYRVGAEIGVLKGYFTRRFCKVGLKMYAVDCWQPYPDFDRGIYGQVKRQKKLYQKAKKVLSHYQNAVLIRKTSMEALADFADGSLDFVYIDANHMLKYVIEDIHGWSKKVKKGGIISGHDYINPYNYRRPYKRQWGWQEAQVMYAVDAYTQANRIKNWYLLGRKKPKPGEKRDKCRSWFWLK